MCMRACVGACVFVSIVKTKYVQYASCQMKKYVQIIKHIYLSLNIN